MLAIEISLNVLWIPAIAAVSAFLGFILRSKQIAKKKKQIISLENEMLKNHAEILKLQRELADLQRLVPSTKTRIVSMKDAPAEEKGEKQDGSAQRKLAQ